MAKSTKPFVAVTGVTLVVEAVIVGLKLSKNPLLKLLSLSVLLLLTIAPKTSRQLFKKSYSLKHLLLYATLSLILV